MNIEPLKKNNWQEKFKSKIKKTATSEDPAHDYSHFERVVKLAETICTKEKAQLAVVTPASWLHDLVIVPKNDPRRSKASKLSAEAALSYLDEINYPKQYHQDIAHAIEAHSFSANIEAKTLEAKIVQDADRLDGLGAIGVARCFATAGSLKRPFYNPIDPFCNTREADDRVYTVDHFYKKLFKTAKTLHTQTAKKIAENRIDFMKKYLKELSKDIYALNY